MTTEILKGLIAANIAVGGAVVLMLCAGPVLRRAFGARLAYVAWLVVPLAGLSALLPARSVTLPVAAAPVRPIAEAAVMVFEAGPSFDWAALVVGAWALGALGLVVLTAWAQSRTLALIGRLTPEGKIMRAASRAIGPATLGILKPRIMVPADFEQRFDVEERAVILAHEEVHIAQGDVRINALIELSRCLLWFNPLVHLAARRIRIDQELACDAAVIARFPKARRTYAEALLKTQTASAPLPLGCYWPERSHKHLKERLTMLTAKTPGRARSLAGAACLALLGLGTGYAAWASAPEPLAPLPAHAPTPAPLAAPTAAPAVEAPREPQQLSNSREAPPQPNLEGDILVDVPSLADARIAGEPGDQISVHVDRAVRIPLPEGFDPDISIDLKGAAVRLACTKAPEGQLSCTRNGEPVEGAELEQLRAQFPRVPPGTANGERVIVFSGRRLAE
jgi:beta-lactamase regulating signal transducer with metallopeptidase domain